MNSARGRDQVTPTSTAHACPCSTQASGSYTELMRSVATPSGIIGLELLLEAEETASVYSVGPDLFNLHLLDKATQLSSLSLPSLAVLLNIQKVCPR